MSERQFTNKEKADCAKREVGQRRKVYARLVAQQKMAQADASREIALMQEIADDYLRVYRGQEPELPL